MNADALMNWKPVLWTNEGIYLTYNQTMKAVKNRVKTLQGECIRFNLYVYSGNEYDHIDGLHWEYRGIEDKNCLQTVLTNLHYKDTKAKFRIFAQQAEI